MTQDPKKPARGPKAAQDQGQLSFGDSFAPPSEDESRVTVSASRPRPGKTARAAAPPPVRPAEDVDLDTRDLAPPAPPAAPEEPKVFGVYELIRSARTVLEARFSDVRVEGEISGLRVSGPGHLYFTLKDTQAQVDCVMFAREAARLKFRPRDGLLVRCRGRLTIYEGRGKFQMTVGELSPAGDGALALAFEQLKQQLANEGLFSESRKRPLPFLPRRLGVVTSPTGAVIRDIIHVAHRRFPVDVLLAPTPVQGLEAAPQIVAALTRLGRVPGVDVIILARGGGSLEDLWAFNEEIVARAIALSPVPVISAVGHETDFTIADFVADLRAPTPSAAAERAVPEMLALRETLANAQRRLHRNADRELHRARLVLERLRARFADPRRLLDRQRVALDDRALRLTEAVRALTMRRRTWLRELDARLLRAHPQKRIAAQRSALAALERRLCNATAQTVGVRKQRLGRLHAQLEALSPLRVLERGYGLVRTQEGHLVTKAAQVGTGTAVHVTVREGAFWAEVQPELPPSPTEAAPLSKEPKP
ncbi:MAG: exodeoxyribonuclease VII large subunit [Myxococcales bacterium]|nr:exodeoxyribonuclease VII large subunit [Myxococcales bacterium]